MFNQLKRYVCIAALLSSFFSYTIFSVHAQVIIEETGSSIFPSEFMPAEGEAYTLVIPVEFGDYRFAEDPVPQLETIFFGDGSALAPSLSDYFEKASYGKLIIQGEVQPVVTLPSGRQAYGKDHVEWIEEIFKILEQRGLDFSRFDQNQDGILDGLYLVWAGQPQNAQSSWWPYSDTFYWDFRAAGVRLGSYSSLSYELLTAPTPFRQYTAIHETGHQLGLTDYYASPTESGTGAGVMMDRNEGDEDCFSKMLLGWITPQVIQKSEWVTLSSAATTPSAALIAPPSWDGNYLSEYFMAEYITPEENQTKQELSAGGAVRIWHVNAATSLWTNDITSSMYRYQNSGSGAKLLTVIDLNRQWYTSGDQITEQQTLLYSGEETGIAIRVEEVQNGKAALCVIYNGEEPAKPETGTESSGHEGQVTESSEMQQSEESHPEEDPAEDSAVFSQEENRQEESAESGTLQNGETAEEAESKKSISTIFPILFVILLAALIVYLLLNDGKKHKKKRKRRK